MKPNKIKVQIQQLENNIKSILLDMENNTEKYNDSLIYSQANEAIATMNNEIENLKYTLVQFEELNNSQDNVKQAITAIQQVIPTFFGCDWENDVTKLTEEKANGLYDPFTQTVTIAKETSIYTIIHEFGHHIHNVINNMESSRVPKTTRYSNTNAEESFAEAFANYVLNNGSYQKADKRMANILLKNF